MAHMTEEEADALDEKLTRTTPKVDFSRPDIFIRQRELLNVLKPTAADYILTRALATRKTPAQIISELVEERIAASLWRRRRSPDSNCHSAATISIFKKSSRGMTIQITPNALLSLC